MAKYTRSNPTAWPNGAYYFLRFIQFVCSLGVAGILGYFIYYLLKGKYGIPVEFIILYVASIFSLMVIISTTVAKCCGALNPKFAAFLDFLALALFGTAFALLTRARHGQVFNDCTNGDWGKPGKNGVWVCRLFKATWAFTAAAVAFYIFSFILDIVVIRRVGNHKYAPANPKSMQQGKGFVPNYTQDTSYGSGGLPSHG